MRLCVPLSSVPNWNICVTQLYPKLLSQTVQDPLMHFFTSTFKPSHLLGGGGGNSTLGGPCGLTPVFGTGDFSNSSTPPCENLERRRGFEPRTPSLQLDRSPLAVAAHGTPGVIRTPDGGFGIRSPHHRQPGRMVGSVGFEPTLDT